MTDDSNWRPVGPCRWCGTLIRSELKATGSHHNLYTCPECDQIVDERCVYVTFDKKPVTLLIIGRIAYDAYSGESYATAIRRP